MKQNREIKLYQGEKEEIFGNNKINTAKYNKFNLIPKNLFE